jgi:hypothetical protein
MLVFLDLDLRGCKSSKRLSDIDLPSKMAASYTNLEL